MKILFDEAGQSGCLLEKENILNFETQPYFTLGALLIKNNEEEVEIIGKYKSFKEKFEIKEEIKGNELVTRNKNNELKYFINNFLDDEHYYIIIYDKKFYLSTLMLCSFMGLEYQQKLTLHFYQQASFLSLQENTFFVEYLKFIENPTLDLFHKYLLFLRDYKYVYESDENAIKTIAKMILESHMEDKFIDDFMTYGWYKNTKIINLINLNALSELTFFVKEKLSLKNENIIYIHDKIEQFEDTFIDELKKLNINISFEDSKNNELLQIVDNITSVTNHTYKRCFEINKSEELFNSDFEWDLKLFSKIQQKLSINNISYTIPLHDWALSLCVLKMFSDKFPKRYRNVFTFNDNYCDAMKQIYCSLDCNKLNLKDILYIMKQ